MTSGRSLADQVEGVTAELEQTLRGADWSSRPERRLGSAAAFASALGAPLGVTRGQVA